MGTIYKWTGKKHSFIDIFPSVRDFAFKSFTVEFYEGLKKANIIQFEFTAHWTINMCMKKKFLWVFLFELCWHTLCIQYCSFMMIIREEVEREWQISLQSNYTLFQNFSNTKKKLKYICIFSLCTYTSLENAKNEIKICRSICFTAYSHKLRKIWTFVVRKRHGNVFYLPIQICYIKKQV